MPEPFQIALRDETKIYFALQVHRGGRMKNMTKHSSYCQFLFLGVAPSAPAKNDSNFGHHDCIDNQPSAVMITKDFILRISCGMLIPMRDRVNLMAPSTISCSSCTPSDARQLAILDRGEESWAPVAVSSDALNVNICSWAWSP